MTDGDDGGAALIILVAQLLIGFALLAPLAWQYWLGVWPW